MTTTRRLIAAGQAASCYFRTSVPDGQRKALVQITERCNLQCTLLRVGHQVWRHDAAGPGWSSRDWPRAG